MKKTANIARKITFGYLLGLMVLIFIGIVTYRSIREFERAAAVVAQSQRILMLVEATMGDVLTAESEARGFVIMGDGSFLSVYEKNVADTAADMRQLRELVMSPEVRVQLDEFERLITARLERLVELVQVRKTRTFNQLISTTPSVGKHLMDDLRKQSDLIEKLEYRLIAEREQRTKTLAQGTTLVIILGSLLAILLAAFSIMVILGDVAQRERLEREVLEISEREQRRIGQDLHDGVCQHLTGIALFCRSLQQKLGDRAVGEAAEAERITGLVNDGIEQTRRVTRGLYPVASEADGLMVALQELANSLHVTDHLACRFECPAPVLVRDQMAATHLYRIAQEAVQNAIRHAKPTTILIRLESVADALTLTISDDGCGLPEQPSTKGLGLDIMNYRAHTLGAKLDIGRGTEGGTIVRCKLPQDATT